MGKTLGKKIQKRRIEVGFSSQGALAKAIGTYRPQVSRWESDNAFPDLYYRNKLKEVLRVDDSFFQESPEPPQKVSPSDRSETLARIITILPTLDNDELGAILASIEALPSQLAPTKRTTLKTE